jgi:hypothetical protein
MRIGGIIIDDRVILMRIDTRTGRECPSQALFIIHEHARTVLFTSIEVQPSAHILDPGLSSPPSVSIDETVTSHFTASFKAGQQQREEYGLAHEK